ncbi:MAG: sulfatase [Deltaproteobacteria bacterium]|nr:sulfatase [Deltaproteobacteria bacterium]
MFRSSPNSAWALAAALVLAGFLQGCTGQRESAPKPGTSERGKPNVLLIVIDDLNDWIEPLGGHPDAKTPHFNRLARRSISFTNAHCDATACNPSRTALLTGLRPSTTGVYKNGQPYLAAVADRPTLMEAFTAAGYRTLGAGKVFHRWGPGKLVWDEYRGRQDDPKGELRESAGLTGRAHFSWGPLDVEDEEMDDAQVVLQAKRWLESPQPEPFFMALGIYLPHLPWSVPQKYFDLYPLDEITLPATPPTDPDDLSDLPRSALNRLDRVAHQTIAQGDQVRQVHQAYLASISFADAMLGRALDALDQSPHRDNTIMVVVSDHGLHLGEKDHWGKYTLWERSTHIPLFISAPHLAAQAGARSAGTVTPVDLYPTLLELADIPPISNLDGRSFASLLEDPQHPWEHPALTTYPNRDYAVRNQRWRYIRYRNGDEELYDHQQDPHEWHNLAGEPKLNPIKEELGTFFPAVAAPDAPVTFKPDDLQATVKFLVRFFEPDKLIRKLEAEAEKRQQHDQGETEP